LIGRVIFLSRGERERTKYENEIIYYRCVKKNDERENVYKNVLFFPKVSLFYYYYAYYLLFVK